MKSGGSRYWQANHAHLVRAVLAEQSRAEADSKPCDRCSGGTWTDSNGVRHRCAYCKGVGRVRVAAYVDGSQDDLTRDLDVITDIAAGGYDPPPAA